MRDEGDRRERQRGHRDRRRGHQQRQHDPQAERGAGVGELPEGERRRSTRPRRARSRRARCRARRAASRVTAVRWRVRRRRKATATRDRGDQRAPAGQLPQRHERREDQRDERRADRRLAASMNSASWLPACSCAARIGPQSVVSAGSYRPSSARASMRGRANWEVVWLVTPHGCSRERRLARWLGA